MGYSDPYGLAEVFAFSPVGHGSSSFGHVAVNIQGTTYSFSPSGMFIETTSAYLIRNNFRSAIGLDLNNTPAEDNALAEFLYNYSEDYNLFTNNCSDPIQKGLDEIGITVEKAMLPSGLTSSILSNIPTVTINRYPSKK